MMSTETFVRARIDGAVKAQAADILAGMGLTLADAIRLMLERVATEKGLPFEADLPNSDTRAAIAEAEEGELPSFASVDELMTELNAPD
jgi:DNA-damage-inducible protein J